MAHEKKHVSSIFPKAFLSKNGPKNEYVIYLKRNPQIYDLSLCPNDSPTLDSIESGENGETSDFNIQIQPID